ncbi:MAG TPA: nuclear transport factor 2 family protein [Mycobacteriales bacterium]|nr:nuclear transport factor 2 family protein [Mycobacteriales bacterium]
MTATAHEEIRNLLGRYCERMDAGDFAGLAALFADGRLADDAGNVFASGTEQMQAMWESQTKMYDGSPRTRHITANPVIDVDETAGTATSSSSYVVFQGMADFAFQPIVSGRYADRFARDSDGRWRFIERRYAVDQVGDLSHHLKFDVRLS